MAIIKSSPSELAIHGGGPAAFASKLPAFSANVGDGQRFGELAEQMFLANEKPGHLAEQFEANLAEWLGVRNVLGFSSQAAAFRCLGLALSLDGPVFAPAAGSSAFYLTDPAVTIDSEASTFGMSATGLAEHLREDASAVFATHVLGRACLIQELEDVCDEWGVPLYFFGHQALGSMYQGERLGSFGQAEIFELGRDQLVHAMDAAVLATDDDLLAHRVRCVRAARADGIDQAISDAAGAMGIANLESAGDFIEANRIRYGTYRELLGVVPGIKLVRQDAGSNYQSIAIEVDPGLSGLTCESLSNVLVAENVGTARPLEKTLSGAAPVALRLANSLLQLPAGPAATEEAIEAVCKLVELAIVRSLESPDPIRLAA
jgi:dTDP-4-amino-4,6-dideoxyglucose